MGVSLAEWPTAGVSMDASRPYRTIRETAALLILSTRTIPRSIVEGKRTASRVAGEKVLRNKRADQDALLEPVGAEAEAPGTEGKQKPHVVGAMVETDFWTECVQVVALEHERVRGGSAPKASRRRTTASTSAR